MRSDMSGTAGNADKESMVPVSVCGAGQQLPVLYVLSRGLGCDRDVRQ